MNKTIILKLGYLATAGMVALILFGVAAGVHAQTAQVTITGEINDTQQLVADGKIYDIAESPEGEDLVRNYISLKVKVIGVLQKGTEIDAIRVRSFEVVDE